MRTALFLVRRQCSRHAFPLFSYVDEARLNGSGGIASRRSPANHVSGRAWVTLLKVAQENDPAWQREDAHYGTGDEARARDGRSRVQALSEDDSKEAARNSGDQNNIASLFERQSDPVRYPEAKGGLKQ